MLRSTIDEWSIGWKGDRECLRCHGVRVKVLRVLVGCHLVRRFAVDWFVGVCKYY